MFHHLGILLNLTMLDLDTSCFENSLRDFPKPDFLGPYQFKNKQKLHKMVYTIPNLLDVLYFGENFMKIRTKIAKLQMHEKNMFSFTFLYKFS